MDDKKKIEELREKISSLKRELYDLERKTVGWYIAIARNDWPSDNIYLLGNITAVEAQEWAEEHQSLGDFGVDIKEIPKERFLKYLALIYISAIGSNIKFLRHVGIEGAEIQTCFEHLETIKDGIRKELNLRNESVHEGFD